MFHEYPKMLVKDAEHRVAHDAAEEAETRAAGFAVYGEELDSDAKPKRKARAETQET